MIAVAVSSRGERLGFVHMLGCLGPWGAGLQSHPQLEGDGGKKPPDGCTDWHRRGPGPGTRLKGREELRKVAWKRQVMV